MLGLNIPEQFPTRRALIKGLYDLLDQLGSDDTADSGSTPRWTLTGQEEDDPEQFVTAIQGNVATLVQMAQEPATRDAAMDALRGLEQASRWTPDAQPGLGSD